jgi:urease accessory protein
MRLRSATLLVLVLPGLALAHGAPGDHAHDGVLAGLTHPFTGLDHLLAMIAVGLWCALGGRDTHRRWIAPLAFVLLLLTGALAARAGLTLPGVEPMIAASLLALGLLIGAAITLPPALVALAIGGFAFFHGLAHGQELAGVAALVGMVLGTVLLHLAGFALGRALMRPDAAGRHIGGAGIARAFGAVTALVGAGLLLGGAFA